MISASKLERIDACPASEVLPQATSTSEQAERGIWVHAFLADCQKLGREDALAKVPEPHRAACEAIDLEALGLGAWAFEAEAGFAYDPMTGKARRLGADGNRSLRPGEIPGYADVFGLDGEAVLIADYKTGHGRVTAANHNWQLRFLAFAAARACGRTRARVAIIAVREDGEPYFDHADFDDLDLEGIEMEIASVVERVEVATPDRVSEGPWCRYCPAFAGCPAKKNLAIAMATAPEDIELGVKAMLTPALAAKAYARLRQVEGVLKHVRAAIYAYAAEQPIDLGEGWRLGETESSREEVNGSVARVVLRDLYGPEIAEAACTFESSKKAIRDALREVAKSRGEPLAKLERATLARLREENGIAQRVSRSVKEHKAKPEEDAAEEAA